MKTQDVLNRKWRVQESVPSRWTTEMSFLHNIFDAVAIDFSTSEHHIELINCDHYDVKNTSQMRCKKS